MDPAKLKAMLRTELDDVARQKAVQGYEIPRDFIVEMKPFSKDNHLLTDSNKPARGQLKKRCAALSSTCALIVPVVPTVLQRGKHEQQAPRVALQHVCASTGGCVLVQAEHPVFWNTP